MSHNKILAGTWDVWSKSSQIKPADDQLVTPESL